jgi:cell cycle checkpoint protein
LSIFAGCGNDSLTSLKLSYDGYGHPLQLILEDNGIVTECSIVTQEADEVLDFDFTSSNVHSRLIIKSECLKEAFAEIDFTNNVLEMIMSPNEPNFKLITNGYIGTTQFDFSSSSEMIEVFECKKTQRNKYRIM